MGKGKCFICKNRNSPFFQFPADMSRRQKWFQAVEMYCDISKIQDFTVVCLNHFRKDSYTIVNNRYRLLKEAVPTTLPLEFVACPPPEAPEEEKSYASKAVQTDIFSINNCNEKSLQNHCEILTKTLKRVNNKYSVCYAKLKALEGKEMKYSGSLKAIDTIEHDAKNGNEKAIFLMDLIENYSKRIKS